MVEAEMRAALAKPAMMKFCLEMNFWGFIHFFVLE